MTVVENNISLFIQHMIARRKQKFGIFYPSIILAGAAIGFFYYLKLIRFIFSDKNINSLDKFDIELEQKFILSVCIAIILLIGLNPNLIDILSRF